MKRKNLNSGEIGLLSELKRGQKCEVIKINVLDKALRRRILDMGVTRGAVIKIKKIAPLGDPVDVYLRGYELCLRKKDMALIEVRCL